MPDDPHPTGSDSGDGDRAEREDPDAIELRSDGAPDPPAFAPFLTEGSQQLVDSRWCSLRLDRVRLESDDGVQREPHPYYVFEVSPAIVVVPVLDDGSILTLWQYRYPLGETHWELPAGRIDAGEEPIQAAARELLEETGHRSAEIRELPGFFPINGISPHYAHAFVARDCRFETSPSLDPSERLSLHRMRESEVRRRLVGGDFRDAFSALALFHYFARRDAEASP